MKLPFFKKADVVLLAVLLVTGAACMILLRGNSRPGNTAIVRVDGEVTDSIPLTQERWQSTVSTKYGSNTLVVENGSIRVEDADCSGKDCTRFAPINKSGQVIICLPHHMSVTVSGGDDAPDAVIH